MKTKLFLLLSSVTIKVVMDISVQKHFLCKWWWLICQRLEFICKKTTLLGGFWRWEHIGGDSCAVAIFWSKICVSAFFYAFFVSVTGAFEDESISVVILVRLLHNIRCKPRFIISFTPRLKCTVSVHHDDERIKDSKNIMGFVPIAMTSWNSFP